MNDRLIRPWLDELRAKAVRYRDNDPLAHEARPLPPSERIRQVNSPEKSDPAEFLRSGVRDLRAIVETLEEAVAGAQSGAASTASARPVVMELGCGLGRLLRHRPPPDLAEMIATDVNADSLAWCRAHLPGVAYHRHDPFPPIASLPTASVDVIYAHSVFTHIPLERHAAWWREVERLLRPGGWLIASFLSSGQQDDLLDAGQRDALASSGAIQVGPHPIPGHDGVHFYLAVCETVAHQEASVGAVFTLGPRRERERRQDVLAARRR